MAKKRAFAHQEKEYQVQRLSTLGRALLMSLATLLSFVAIVFLAADQLYRPDTFVITELKIKGKFRYLSASEVERVVRNQDPGNFFSVKLDEMKSRIEALAWVQRADVRREWPNSLSISIVEHQPAMRWGKNRWVSTEGAVLELPSSLKASRAIRLYGNDAQAKRILLQAASWKKNLQQDGIELTALRLSDSEAWTLSLRYHDLDSDFKLLLGRENINARLARFKTLFQTQLRFSEYRLERIDARYPDGLAVELGKTKLSNDEIAKLTTSNALAVNN